METDIIYNEDCLKGLSKIPDKSIDLIVTDPPYNMGKDFENDNLKKQEYLEWYEKWIDEALRTLRENGSIYIFQSHHLISEIKLLLDSKGLVYRNWITWVFRQGMGASKNFSYRHEDILFYSKPFDSSDFIKFLNQARIKKGLSLSDINKHFGMATNGGGCASQWMGDKKDNTLPTKEQFIELKKLLDLKDDFDEWFFERRKGFVFNFDDIAQKPVRKDKGIRESGKNPSNVWEFDCLMWNNPQRVNHPTQKPLNLIKRMVLASSNKEDTILDPFMGSGTTALACKELNRRYIGFEKDSEYCKIISKRLSQQILSNLSATPRTLLNGNPNGEFNMRYQETSNEVSQIADATSDNANIIGNFKTSPFNIILNKNEMFIRNQFLKTL